MARDGCVYCGGRPLTREHAIPEWIEAEYGGKVGYRVFVNGVEVGRRSEIVGRHVCKPCNEWMGTEFESPTKPLLRPLIEGEPSVLDAADRALLGRWTVKTALMLALTRPEHGLPEPEEYQAMRCTGLPRVGTTVRALVAQPPEATPKPGQQVGRAWLPPQLDKRQFLAVGAFGAVIDRREQFSYGADPLVVRLWPVDGGTVLWPPPGRIVTRSFLDYAGRL